MLGTLGNHIATVSPQYGGRELYDPGGDRTGSPIRLRTGSNTLAGQAFDVVA